MSQARRILGILVLLAACAALPAAGGWLRADTASTEEAVPGDEAEARIRSKIEAGWGRYREALRRGDARGLGAMFTEDGILMEPQMPEIRGREGIVVSAAPVFASSRILEVSSEIREISVHDDAVFDFGTYTETVQTYGEKPIFYQGRYAALWRLQPDGEWKIHRMMLHDRKEPKVID